MLEPDIQPELVGRENSLGELQRLLEQAGVGNGGTVFISGEAGIGKTRLVEELKKSAESNGFQVLSGYGLYESYTPYMPFMEALRSGGLEYLLAEEAPKVEAVYLMTSTGLLVKEILREETDLDPDLFASMLSTVGDFVRDSLSMLKGEETLDTLNRLGIGEHSVLIESGEAVNLAVIVTGGENEFLIDDMKDILTNVDREYGGILEKWDGVEEKVEGIARNLRPLIESGKYDGIFHGMNDPQSRRNLLFENVSLGLTRQAQLVPTLLCVEDLQWADPSTLSLIHYVARNTRKCSLLILGTYRPEYISLKEGEHHPLVETMQLMSREGLYEELELQRLPERSMKDFLTSVLGSVDLTEEFIGALYEETEGNPLYIMELLKLLAEEEMIENVEGFWKLAKAMDEVVIPSKIYDVIVRRLNRIETGDRRVLDYASVIGDFFTSEILSNALRMDRVPLLERLRVLERTHRLVHTQNGEFGFDHAKVREILYGEIPRELRMEYHRIVAASIESTHEKNLDKVVGDLAFHYYRSRNKDKAPYYLVKAAQRAKESFSNEEAIRFYSESLEFEEDPERRREVLEDLGALYELVGEHNRSLEAYIEALEHTDKPDFKARIKVKIGGVYENKGDFDHSLSALNEALEMAGDTHSDAEAGAQLGIGSVFWCRGDYGKAEGHFQNCLEIGEKIGDENLVASALTNIGNLELKKGEYGKALEKYERSFKLRERLGEQRTAAHALSNIGALYYHKGEYEKALRRYERSLEMLEKIGDQKGIAYSLNNMGVLHEDRAEYDKALKAYERSLKILEKIGDQANMAASLHNVGLIHRHLGEYDKALSCFTKSLDMCEEIGYRVGLAFNCAGIAEIHMEKRDLTSALDYCKRAFEVATELGAEEYVGASKRIYGMIHRELGEWEESIKNFEGSIKVFEEIGRDKELGDTHYEFGLMWKNKGELNKAKDHLKRSIHIFGSLDLEKELREAKEALDELI